MDIEAEAVIAANEAFYAAFNAKDIEAMDAVWAVSDEASCIHPGWNVLRGRETVLDSWRNILSNTGQPKIVSGGAEVIFAGDAAIVICRELVAGMPLAATNVFVREDGDWKLLHHQSGGVQML